MAMAQTEASLFEDNHYPLLHTQDFGDCLGGKGLVDVTRFDVAYHADNLAVVFHLEGTTNVVEEDVIRKCGMAGFRACFLLPDPNN